MITEKLGDRIKELRINKGISQEKFALSIAHLKIYAPPFNDEHYSIKPVSWYIENEI